MIDKNDNINFGDTLSKSDVGWAIHDYSKYLAKIQEYRIKEFNPSGFDYIRDDTGTPKIFYHLTKDKFDKFDLSKKRMFNAEYGKGFYFCDIDAIDNWAPYRNHPLSEVRHDKAYYKELMIKKVLLKAKNILSGDYGYLQANMTSNHDTLIDGTGYNGQVVVKYPQQIEIIGNDMTYMELMKKYL